MITIVTKTAIIITDTKETSVELKFSIRVKGKQTLSPRQASQWEESAKSMIAFEPPGSFPDVGFL